MKEIIEWDRYKYFGHFCEVPTEVLDNLKNFLNELKDTVPDQRRVDVYDQWWIQKTNFSNPTFERTWKIWQDNNKLNPTKDFFNQYVKNICKFRMSILFKTYKIGEPETNPSFYHDRHSLPRIHIPLNDSGSSFVIKDKGVEYEYKMDYGHAHFINVTFHHRVVSPETMDRHNSFFCFTHFANKKLHEQFLR